MIQHRLPPLRAFHGTGDGGPARRRRVTSTDNPTCSTTDAPAAGARHLVERRHRLRGCVSHRTRPATSRRSRRRIGKSDRSNRSSRADILAAPRCRLPRRRTRAGQDLQRHLLRNETKTDDSAATSVSVAAIAIVSRGRGTSLRWRRRDSDQNECDHSKHERDDRACEARTGAARPPDDGREHENGPVPQTTTSTKAARSTASAQR